MKYINKFIALSIVLALYSQTAIGHSQCDCKEDKANTTEQTKQKNETTDKVTAEIAVGELVDKITILQIKSKNITDQEKLKNIHTELETLLKTLHEEVPESQELEELTEKLLDINKQLWDIEDAIRDKERDRCFDHEFIEIARSVYYTNDERCRVKRQINNITGSRLFEEKSYASYQ